MEELKAQIATANRELGEVKAELTQRPTKEQFRTRNILISIVLLLLATAVGVGAYFAIQTIDNQSKTIDKQTEEISTLKGEVNAVESIGQSNNKILDKIEQVTGECAQARGQRNITIILNTAEDLIRRSHGQPPVEHPPLPKLPEGCHTS